MKEHKIEILYPEDQVIEGEIQRILIKGLEPKKTFWSQLTAMYRQLGFKYLFSDLTEVIFGILSGLVILLFALPNSLMAMNPVYIYPLIFTLSPLIYLVTALWFFYRLPLKPTFEIEMTCRYHVYQLAAFRMLIFSGASILFNGTLLYQMTRRVTEMDFLLATGISIASLFIFATTFLFVLLGNQMLKGGVILFLGWFGGNGWMTYFGGIAFSQLLSRIPFYLYWAVGGLALVLYFKSLQGLMNFKRLRGNDGCCR